jgi:2-oxoglutarate ferredoxin oxidoreductase subunit beta
MTPHGTGIRPFQPAAIALAAGASFVARGFSGDPKELTRLLVEAVRHPGFSFLHVLSPCLTFRPEQRNWKSEVHAFSDGTGDSLVDAERRVHADDGMGLGIIYAERLPAWQPNKLQPRSLDSMEEEFLI